MKKFIYKICSKLEWSKFKKKKIFYGTKQDIIDGYIHFSKKTQVKSTLNKHFFKKNKLILLKVDATKLKKLVWEKSADEILFPHLYSYLNLKDVKKNYNIFLKKNGSHFFLSKY
jgi:uncharacterized protein (DUF952 family)